MARRGRALHVKRRTAERRGEGDRAEKRKERLGAGVETTPDEDNRRERGVAWHRNSGIIPETFGSSLQQVSG